MAGVGLSEKVTFEQRPDHFHLPLPKGALWSEGEHAEGVGLPREQFQFLAALPSLGLIMFVLQHCAGPAVWHRLLLPSLQFPVPPDTQLSQLCRQSSSHIPETLREWAAECA